MLIKFFPLLLFTFLSTYVYAQESTYSKNQLHYKNEPYYGTSVHKIEGGLVNGEKNYIFLGYSFCKVDGDLDMFREGIFNPPKPEFIHGPTVGVEAAFAKKPIYTAKAGYRMLYDNKFFPFSLQATGGLHTNFQSTSSFVSPQIGLCFLEFIDIYYAHEFPLGGNKQIQFTHKFGILTIS